MAGRGMGAAVRGGGAVSKGPKNKVISETSKKTGPVMMARGGIVKMRNGGSPPSPGPAVGPPKPGLKDAAIALAKKKFGPFFKTAKAIKNASQLQDIGQQLYEEEYPQQAIEREAIERARGGSVNKYTTGGRVRKFSNGGSANKAPSPSIGSRIQGAIDSPAGKGIANAAKIVGAGLNKTSIPLAAYDTYNTIAGIYKHYKDNPDDLPIQPVEKWYDKLYPSGYRKGGEARKKTGAMLRKGGMADKKGRAMKSKSKDARGRAMRGR